MKKDKYLLLGNDRSMKHVGISTKAGKVLVLLIMFYCLTIVAALLVIAA